MKSAYAALIEAYFTGGGTITICPPGNGLGDPALRMTPKQAVGGAKPRAKRRRSVRARVLLALEDADRPLTMAMIERATKVPFSRLRYAVAALERDGKICGTPGGSGRTRYFKLPDTGAGTTAGGPASASAPEARDRFAPTSGARPGRAAA